jgi:hypothetical protein
MEDVDQSSVSCPTYGKEVKFDRWSDESQEYSCSEECKEKMQKEPNVSRDEEFSEQNKTTRSIGDSARQVLSSAFEKGDPPP